MWCFNPRTPAGCDFPAADNPDTYREFQSTHPCGVRLTFACSLAASVAFQSTHPCGVRPGPWTSGRIRRGVSIHAPLRGATKLALAMDVFGEFQSTHPCGVRLAGPVDTLTTITFQSTHPCGVRRYTLWHCIGLMPFQSTHPCGVRQQEVMP